MTQPHSTRGAWLIVLASLITIAICVYDYYTPETGLIGSGGLIFVAGAAVLMLLASLAMAKVPGRPAWVQTFLVVSILLDIIGSGTHASQLDIPYSGAQAFDGRKPTQLQAPWMNGMYVGQLDSNKSGIFPGWMIRVSETAKGLADGVQADQAFERLPILADALEEAGCTDTDLLAHLREPGLHVRGCWALDLVLGKG